MELNRSTYEELVGTDLDFDEYLKKMSNSRTYGTLTELRAVAYRFKRNVLLFEAYNSGNWYVSEPEFSESLLVFYVPQKHFDSIYPKSYLESIAFCQSITYEIIYSHVFMLPDVIYAVERMLHDENEETYVTYIGMSPYDDSQESLTLSDGRHFLLDRADETECILDNYLLCHFHNKSFDQIQMQLQRDSAELPNDVDACYQLNKWIGALLPRRNVSCVRQLLDENITPFSYKVAKSLDSNIYRNVEFHVWHDARRTVRKAWQQRNLQVGVKCLVDIVEWSQPSSYFAQIQEMYPHNGTCDVYIERLGSRKVPLSSITVLPNQSQIISTDHYEKREITNFDTIKEAAAGEQYKDKKKENFYLHEEKMSHYLTRPIHIAQQYSEYIAYPQYSSNRTSKNDDTGKGNNSSSNKNATIKKNAAPAASETKPTKVVEMPKTEYEPHRHARSQIHVTNDWNAVNQHMYSNIQSSSGCARRTDIEYNYHGHKIASMIKRKDVLPSMNQINMNAQESLDVNGRDLPYNDIRTLRFFYNLGIDFLRFLREVFPAKTISTFFNPVETPYQRGRYHNYDNSNELADLSVEFQRNAQISFQDQYSKPTDVGQQHQRPYTGANTPGASKKYSKNYRYDYNRSNRPLGEDPTKYMRNYSNNSAEYMAASLKPETNAWTQTDPGFVPQYDQLASAPPTATQPFYPYYPADIPDSTNMYLYGYYQPMNENMVAYQMVPTGMGLPDPDEFPAESELAQTYPYYNSNPEMYYYPQPFPPMAMPPQQGGCWYPQQLPITMPTTMATTSMPTTPMPSTSMPTTSYGQYTVFGTKDDHSNNTTNAPFTPNEPLNKTEDKRKCR